MSDWMYGIEQESECGGDDNGSSRVGRREILKATAAVSTVTIQNIGVSEVAATESQTTSEIDATLIEADSAAGFNFPYYLYAPADAREKPMLVEPVNSGTASDDFQEDLDAAERTVKRGQARTISDELRVPLIIPVFANPKSDEFWNRFVQSLDTETMQITSGRFERIDRQMVQMIEDARSRLAAHGIEVPDSVMLNGFSASGNFVNNFTILQPGRVASVTAGAINGTATLPVAEAKGETVNYQIGIADIEQLTGSPFDATAWRETPQLCYMGAAEERPNDDTIPYRDVWNETQAEKALRVYGENMQKERMPFCEAVYADADAAARFEVYDGVGHSYSEEILNDIIDFHRRHNNIEDARILKRPSAGAKTVRVSVFLGENGTSNPFEVRAFVNDRDRTATTAQVPAGVPSDFEVELSEAVAAGDEIKVAVLPPGVSDSAQAAVSAETTVVSQAAFATEPQDGDTEVEVSYELNSKFDQSVILSVVPDGDSQYWKRRIRLNSVSPGESTTQTFQLETDNEGVPFSAGDEIELWFVPSGNQVRERALELKTVTISGDDGTTAQPGTCETAVQNDHEAVDVGFVEQPTVGSDSVKIGYDIGRSFTEGGRLRLFPETGGGRWGLGLDRIDPGTEGEQSYSIDASRLTLGESLDVRMFPQDWSNLDDVVASECAVVSGVTFSTPPEAGDTVIESEYLYPASFDEPAELHIRIDGEEYGRLTTIEPGTREQTTFDLETSLAEDVAPLAADIDFELVLQQGTTSAVVDTATREIPPAGQASVFFTETPGHLDRSVTIEYSLGGQYEVDEFVALRLYTDRASSWGIYLDEVSAGNSGTETIDINLDEAGVPLRQDDAVRVALVDNDDPYAETPLAVASTVVGADISQGVEVSFSDPPAGPVSPTQDLTLPVTVSNPTDSQVYGTLRLTVGQQSFTQSVEVGQSEEDRVEFVVPAAALKPDAELTITAATKSTEARLSITTEAQTTGGEESATESSPASADGSGFGSLAAISGIGGVGYLIRWLIDGQSQTDETE